MTYQEIRYHDMQEETDTMNDQTGLTPQRLARLARRDADQDPDARSKPLVVHPHCWDRWAFQGDGGIALSIRVQGEYIDRAFARFRTRQERDGYARELERVLAGGRPRD